MLKSKTLLKALRIFLGWIFLWPFLDKLFGLGFGTCRLDDGSVSYLCERAWAMGGSPTTGFLANTSGPFANFFQSLSGLAIVDWLFMLGLLGIGTALIINRYVKFASAMGTLLLILMYLASAIPPTHNPIIDEHIIYAVALLYIGKRAE
ncbi:MAG: hypothetical protein Q8Q32_03600 [bacterium]|nr:hypothetical protein [bacterium]